MANYNNIYIAPNPLIVHGASQSKIYKIKNRKGIKIVKILKIKKLDKFELYLRNFAIDGGFQ